MSLARASQLPPMDLADVDDHVELGRAVVDRLLGLEDLDRRGVAAVGEADRRADGDARARAGSAARGTAYGLMQTLATRYFIASLQPSSSSSSVRVGPRSEWSMRRAIRS